MKDFDSSQMKKSKGAEQFDIGSVDCCSHDAAVQSAVTTCIASGVEIAEPEIGVPSAPLALSITSIGMEAKVDAAAVEMMGDFIVE